MKVIRSVFLSVSLLLMLMQVKAQSTTVSASINDVTASYMDVKNALFASDANTAQAKAKILNDRIGAVSTKDMTADQQAAWKSYADKLSFDSRHISEVSVIDHQREHFASLSKSLYAVLKVFKVNNQIIYWQYCPMKKASWLSETAAIKNPYYGKASMGDCGKVTAILKEAK